MIHMNDINYPIAYITCQHITTSSIDGIGLEYHENTLTAAIWKMWPSSMITTPYRQFPPGIGL